jgi:P4 family phage/plasmid primase-like protien
MFKKTLDAFATDNYQTHLSLVGGKYNVSKDSFDTFYQEYYTALVKKEKLYLVEKVNKGRFRFFLDLEYPKDTTDKLDDTAVATIIDCVSNVLNEYEHIVSKRESNYHVTFYNAIVDEKSAMTIINKVKSMLDEPLHVCIDTSVYKTGLRMLGSQKRDNSSVYRIYDLENGEYTKRPSYESFLKTCILDANCINNEENETVKIKSGDHGDHGDQGDYTSFYETMCEHFDAIDASKPFIVKEALDTSGLHSLYFTPESKFCPFKRREHRRDSNPVFIVANTKQISIRCHDKDCSKKKILMADNDTIGIFTRYPEITDRLYKKTLEASGLTENDQTVIKESMRFTHFSISTAFVELFPDFRVDEVKNPSWYKFDGVRWKKTNEIHILLSKKFIKYYKKFKNLLICEFDFKGVELVESIVKKLEDTNYKSNIMSQIAYLYNAIDPEFVEKLDSREYLLGFENGVYDFEEMRFREGRKEDYLTNSTGYDYNCDDNSEEQLVMDFLSKILPDKHILEYVLKALGKMLVGRPDEKFHVFTGISGANGKSTLISFLEYALGDYAVGVDIGLLTTKRRNPSNANPDIIRLRGRRLFSFQEPEHSDKINTGLLKQFSGGDVIVARDLYKAPISFKTQGSMFMCCNDLPTIDAADGGTWRRIKVIEFNSRFCENPNPDKPYEFEIDLNVKYNIKAWRNTFINVLIKYYKAYLKEGNPEPVEVNVATNLYKNESDKFVDFLDEHYTENKDAFTSTQDVYSAFSMWWLEHSPNVKTPEPKELKRALKIKYGRERSRACKDSKRSIKGFRIECV